MFRDDVFWDGGGAGLVPFVFEIFDMCKLYLNLLEYNRTQHSVNCLYNCNFQEKLSKSKVTKPSLVLLFPIVRILWFFFLCEMKNEKLLYWRFLVVINNASLFPNLLFSLKSFMDVKDSRLKQYKGKNKHLDLHGKRSLIVRILSVVV